VTEVFSAGGLHPFGMLPWLFRHQHTAEEQLMRCTAYLFTTGEPGGASS
jgi:hypothetical protein